MKKCFSCVLLLLSVLLASVFLVTQASADDSFEENRSANNKEINSKLQDKNYARVDRLEVRVLSRDEATNDNDNQAPLSKYQYQGVVREQEFIDSNGNPQKVNGEDYNAVSNPYKIGNGYIMVTYQDSELNNYYDLFDATSVIPNATYSAIESLRIEYLDMLTWEDA